MAKHITGTREEWLAVRLQLLEVEKELTRRSDEVAQRRQELPWVRVDKGVPVRGGGRECLVSRPLQRALAAPCLPSHVRAGVRGGVSGLLGDRRWVQRLRYPPRKP